MCLVFNAREQTKDVDAIFHPKAKVYDLAKKVAQEQSPPPDWFNDSAKDYVKFGRTSWKTVFRGEQALNAQNLSSAISESTFELNHLEKFDIFGERLEGRLLGCANSLILRFL